MKVASFRALALASLASLAMATSSSAVTILQFSQRSPTDGNVIATAAGANTTLTTNSAAAAGSIPVFITTIGGVQLAPIVGPGGIIPAFETFRDVTSTGPAIPGTTIDQPFRGTILFTSLAGGSGTNFLTATFVGGALTGLAGGGSAALIASDPPTTNVVFTSDDQRVRDALAALGPDALMNFALSFSGIVQPPGFSLSGATVASFTARNTGTFDATAVVPEPSGLVMAGTAMLGSLGCIGWRRRQSSRA